MNFKMFSFGELRRCAEYQNEKHIRFVHIILSALSKACNTKSKFDYRPDTEYDIVFSSGVLHFTQQTERIELCNNLKAHTTDPHLQ